MASPAHQPSRSPSKSTARRSSRSSKKTKLAPLPFDLYIPVPISGYAIFHKYGVTAGLVVLKILEKTAGDFKAGRPADAVIEDSEFLEVTNTSDEQLRKIKRRLEDDGIIPAVPDDNKTGRARRYRVNIEALDKLAEEGVPKRENPVNREKCRPRTEPAPVAMVQIPGSATMATIHDACTAAGGWGKLCECPLHHLPPPAEEPPADAVQSPAPEASAPEAQEHKECIKNAPKNGEVLSAQQSTPNYSWGKEKAKVPDSTVSDRKLSARELLMAVEPLCYDVWGKSPAGGPMMARAVDAMEGQRDAIPFLLLRIEDCRGKRRQGIGLLAYENAKGELCGLAAQALNDYKLAAAAEARQRDAEAQHWERRVAEIRQDYARADEQHRAALREAWSGAIDFEGEG